MLLTAGRSLIMSQENKVASRLGNSERNMNMNRLLLAMLFCSFGFVAHAADTISYEGVHNAESALQVMKDNDDQNAILIMPLSIDNHRRQVIEIKRGRNDNMTFTGNDEERLRWTNATKTNNTNVDCSKMPAGMSFSDFLEEQHSIKEIEFLSGASTYELKIHTKKKEVSLIGNIGLVKEFSDGAVLILIASKSAAITDFFQKTLAVP